MVESYAAGQELALESVALDNSVTQRCGARPTLLSGETGLLTLTLRNVGALQVEAGQATLTSTNANLTFPDGAGLAVPALAPRQKATVTARVALASSATGVQPLDFTLSFPVSANVAAVSTTLTGNALSFPAQSASDDVESPDAAWASASDPAMLIYAALNGQPWRRYALSATSHRWWAADLGYPTDLTLTSPNLLVRATGDFTFSFKHRFDLADVSTPTTPFKLSGGVVEVAVVPVFGDIPAKDWKDVGTAAGYNGKVYVDTRDAGVAFMHSPLEGRSAFVGKSATFPALAATTVNLGTAYAGKTVRVRFRLGTGYLGVGAQGWEIDDLEFTNLVGTPFAALVPAGAACVEQPLAVVGARQTVDERTTVTLDGHASTGAGTLKYQWTQVAGAAVALSAAADAKPTFTAPEVKKTETLVFQLVVDNGQLSSVPVLAFVDVKDTNRAPVAAPGLNLTATSGDTVTLDGSASSDADGDALTYLWGESGGHTLVLKDPSSAKASFVAPEAAGTYEVRLTVSDGTLTSSATSFKITVSSGGCQSFPGAGGLLQLLPLALVMLGARRRRRG